MKILFKYVLTFLCIIAMTNNIIAQFVNQTLTFLPSNPTTTDNIKVVSENQFGNTSCNMTSSTITSTNYKIDVTAYHNIGLNNAICYTKDTITIGSFAPGAYKLVYTIRHTSTNNQYGKDSLNFTITGPNGVKETEALQHLKLYPNPVKDVLIIESAQPSLTEDLDYTLVTILGQELADKKSKASILKDNTLAINIKDLPAGIYFIRFNYKGQFLTKKIIKE
ncbi:MAG: T9SS type A sorting domain-containing protein [Bacteroidetes bacterium]|nr:T9SS type A sorting domain-containing protein [Bacteroidota bacterium]